MSRQGRGAGPRPRADYEHQPEPATTDRVSRAPRLRTGRSCRELHSTTPTETDTNGAASRVTVARPKPDELRRVIEPTHSSGFLAPVRVPI